MRWVLITSTLCIGLNVNGVGTAPVSHMSYAEM